MNDSVDWSGGNDFIGNLLRAIKAIEDSTTTIPSGNQIVVSNNLWRKIQELISDEERPMKVEMEDYDR